MGELEPDDSRDVTMSDQRAPGEPPRTGPREGETRGRQQQQQSQRQSDWRATEEGREAQDHEFAGDTGAAPSLRAEADDGQWSQQPADEGAHRQPQQGEPGIRPEAELRGPRDSMRQPDDDGRRQQAERGGG